MNLHLVVGLGKTGLSCVRYLIEQGVPVAVTDTRAEPPELKTLRQEYPEIPVELGQISEKLCDRAAVIVLSPGVSLDEPAIASQIKKGKSIIGDVELFAQAAQAPIIGITGSNGKSTVTTLVGLILEVAGLDVIVGGNIGEPVLNLLQKPTPDYYVLELSSFQLETARHLSTHSSVVMNVTPDHLDRHLTMEHYRQAKQRIYHHCKHPIINLDEPETWKTLALKKTVSFSVQDPSADFYSDGSHLFYQGESLVALKALAPFVQIYPQNALAAMALCHACDVDFEPMLSVLKKFEALPHRCHPVRTLNEVTWYNDSKGTNIGATEAAIKTVGDRISGKVILIAGGQAKGAEFSGLSAVVKRYVNHLIVMGEDAPLLIEALHSVTCTHHVDSLSEAVKLAATLTQPGDAVLLSPACASFDMFKNYADRGEKFIQAVNAL